MKRFCIAWLVWCCCITVFATTYTYTPSQLSALKTQLDSKLQAGDIAYLEDGTYTDFQVTFKGNGTESSPITLKARNPGKAILTGKLNLKISGKYLIIDGLVFKDGQAASGDIVEFRTSSSSFANNCRMTHCVMDNCNNPDSKYYNGTDNSERWIMLYGKNNKVDHCYFANKTAGGVLMMISLDNTDSQENSHIIEYNFFGYRQKFEPGNNAETIRIGDSKTSRSSSATIIRNNFFYTCDGEAETVSIKSCDNLVSQNIFYESAGSVVCRHGNRNTIEENVFIGNSKSNCGGVRIINKGQQVRNNFFQEIAGTGSRSALCVMMGIFEVPTSGTNTDREPLNAYHHVTEAIVNNNTFINCKNIDLGTNVSYTYDSSNPYYPGKKVDGTLKPEAVIASNVFYNPGDKSILNEVSGNVSSIACSNNSYMFKSTISKTGFIYQSMNYAKITSGAGKGIHTLNGAQVKPFAAAGVKCCGVSWYAAQQSDVNTINAKTDFWENPLTVEPAVIYSSVKVTVEKSKGVKIESPNALIDTVVLYNLEGKQLSFRNFKDYSCQFPFFGLSTGVYLLKIRTEDGNHYFFKISNSGR
ncbi:MAG: T9SS type A sorting domain-containing protein [Bacteroidales bacterium]|jgi:poly(beta-D-mannuronate) lyase|nr:T9SS type A sorting domain-containing protein [Bacteroidales bacterium]